MASQSQIHQLHFLLVPLMSQSHLIPFTEMAKLLAHHGVKVTMIFTPLNAARFNTVLEEAKAANLNIEFVSLRFPGPEAGLPEGCVPWTTEIGLKFKIPRLVFYTTSCFCQIGLNSLRARYLKEREKVRMIPTLL
ncbi:hypothetical protein CMV_008252 [Castanea mollissima]|uniref:Uncharacterized protein n=1 Tax=Castanea mollissima TaxID=60419 RepID=A0A8J4W279_9ROSI|nr:hypothetical protein CMV_008252 [Castanea mollissima]